MLAAVVPPDLRPGGLYFKHTRDQEWFFHLGFRWKPGGGHGAVWKHNGALLPLKP